MSSCPSTASEDNHEQAILLKQGYEVHKDETLCASWGYSNSERTLISYDTTEIAGLKVKYIMKEGLGGAMWWEISGDKDGNGSLIDSVLDGFKSG